MTTTPWNWLHNLAVPALLAAVSATWVAAWLGVATHLGTRPADVAWPVVAVPAVLAVTVASVAVGLRSGALGPRALHPRSSRTPAPHPRAARPPGLHPPASRLPARRRVPVRELALMVVSFLAIALVAGTTAALAGHGGLLTVAFHPWDLRSPHAVAQARLDWTVSVVAWAGGLFLGWREPELRRAVTVVAVAGAMLATFLLVAAVQRHGAFHHLGGTVAVALIASFPAAGAAVALTYERDVEIGALRSTRTRPQGAWLAALGVPLAAVAVVAVLVALVVGPVAPVVGRALRQLVVWIADGIGTLLRALAGLFGPIHATARHPTPSVGAHPAPLAPTRTTPTPVWLEVVGVVVGVIIALLVLVVVGRALLRLYRRLRARTRPLAADGAVEEVDSVFSWSHLLDQLRTLLRRPFDRARRGRRSRRSAAAPSLATGSPDGAPESPESVRAHYLALLRAARAGGRGRHPAETPIELARRLADPDGADPDLDALTRLYDDVRYGDLPAGPEAGATARRHVAAVTARLDAELAAVAPAASHPSTPSPLSAAGVPPAPGAHASGSLRSGYLREGSPPGARGDRPGGDEVPPGRRRRGGRRRSR